MNLLYEKRVVDYLKGASIVNIVNKVKRLHSANTLSLAVKGQIGDLISRTGSFLGIRQMIYNHLTFVGFQRAALEIAPVLVPEIIKLFPYVKSVVDFGCGTGVYVVKFREQNLISEGYEYDDYARVLALKMNNVEIYPFDLNIPFELNKHFDLSLCLEVAEHLDPVLGETLVDVCCKYSNIVIFSAGHPGQKGQGHINLQTKLYWIEKFSKRNFLFDINKTEHLESYLRNNLVRGFWVADNIIVFLKEL